MSRLSLHSPLAKRMTIHAAQLLSRTYIRYGPTVGRRSMYEFYQKNLAWHACVQTVRMRDGPRIQLIMPDIISETIYLTGQWEPTITAYVRSALLPGEAFIDIGANIGYYALLASKLVGKNGRVYAIEASPSIFSQLAHNIAINGCANVVPIHAAAGSVPGMVPVFRGPQSNRGHTTIVASLSQKERLEQDGLVRCDRLDRLIDTEALKAARLIKIDVEGAERLVLSPLFESLDKFNKNTEWLLELSPEYCAGGQEDVDTIFNVFIAKGYRVYSIRNEYTPEFRLHPPRRIELNRLFESPRLRQCDVLMTRSPIENQR